VEKVQKLFHFSSLINVGNGTTSNNFCKNQFSKRIFLNFSRNKHSYAQFIHGLFTLLLRLLKTAMISATSKKVFNILINIVENFLWITANAKLLFI
jgi:hypothetical protein